MKIKGVGEYLKDPWNWIDLVHFMLFFAYYLIRINNSENATVVFLMKDYGKWDNEDH